MKILSYCLDWHISSSAAFSDMLVEPLKDFVDIKLTAWDGAKLPQKPKPDETLIFSMLPPPESLLKSRKHRLVWLPMWDQAQGYDQAWWNTLPKDLRVVAFSEVIYKKAKAAGLPTLRLTYYKNPADFAPVGWEQGVVAFYWNRTGMVGPEFITQFCSATRAKKFIFLGQIDPRIEENKFYKLPKSIGETEIVAIKPSDRDSFLEQTKMANVVIAPRTTEGVGMTFLEAMCRGSAVIAHNAPTMSEYIQHGKNGLLLSNDYHSAREKLRAKLQKTALADNVPSPYLLSDHQPWKQISHFDFKKLGDNARADHIAGYKQWQKDIKKYADFVLNW